MNITQDIQQIMVLHQASIISWNEHGIQFEHIHFLKLVEENHAFNYQLWQAEDSARRDDMGYEFVYRAKRHIDCLNQQRNNRMEAMDEWLYVHLQPVHAATCPMHSETPAMMIDRLSILALKTFYMGLQVQRQEVDAQHHQTCYKKLLIIEQQRDNLHHCLMSFIQEIHNKVRTFIIYHPCKMYNDPSLNPELYSHI